ncbi:MAG: hypothetical protein B6I18_06010 [Bacteroidetes bacterium 4572_112]|nr:MAG: hypothetical protein B6I18_06010 [Bacteroidetes bacterium 4572_112]
MQLQMALRKYFGGLLVVLLLFGVVFSCKKHEQYPIEPVIEFKSIDKISNISNIDDKAFLTITFTDGDGDIGLELDDTLPPFNPSSEYYYNYYITYFEKLNDTFRHVDLPFTFNTRIPFIEEDLAERGVKGEIRVELFINNINSTADSIRFDLQIIDRAHNKSNIITTPSIFVKKAK